MTPPKKPPRRVFVSFDPYTSTPLSAFASPDEARDESVFGYDVTEYVLAPKRRAKKRKGA